MKKLPLLMLALIVISTAVAFSQRRSPDSPPLSRRGRYESSWYSRDPSIIQSMKGKITEVYVNEQSIVVEDSKGVGHRFTLNTKTRLKADRSSSLFGKKVLALADLQSGQRVRVSFIPAEGQVVEVKLR